MKAHHVRRLVKVSCADLAVDGDRRSRADRFELALLRWASPVDLSLKQTEYRVIRTSDLDWTIVRPWRLNDGPRTGRYRIGYINLWTLSSISRVDLAEFTIHQLDSGSFIRKAPMIGY